MLNASGTVLVGIGNIVHSDDGAGVYAARILREHPGVPKEVTVIEGGTLGLELLPYLQHAARIVILDAIDVGEAPGAIIELSGAEVTGLRGSWSVHQLGVADLLCALKLLRDDEPEIVLIGVQPKSTEWGLALSPEVNAAMVELTETAINCLAAHPSVWRDQLPGANQIS